MKRLLDIFFSSIGLLLFLPLFVVVAILIKMDSHGPVFFTQRKVGRHFKPFHLYKFRTMVHDEYKKGLLITASGDLRITKFGNFLRKTNIDELPQLWNVLKGDMSFVGPRPEVEKHVNIFKEDYKEILKIRPGVIDIYYMKYSNEEVLLKDKNDPEDYYINILLPEKIRLAKNYIRKSSIVYDFKLILHTNAKLILQQRFIKRVLRTIFSYRESVVISSQLAIFIISSYLAFFIRFEGNIPSYYIDLFIRYLPLLVIYRTFFLFFNSLDKGLWRYVDFKDLSNIAFATSLGSVSFVMTVRFLFGDIAYPLSVYMIDWFLNIFLLVGIRMIKRFYETLRREQKLNKRVIIIGAGDGAEMLLGYFEQSSLCNYEVIGLIDDNHRKRTLKIKNVTVMGTREDLKAIVDSKNPDEFIVAIPSLSNKKFREIVDDLRQYGLPVKKVPGLWGIISGHESLSDIKMVEPEDILFRPPVNNNNEELKTFLQGKSVMVTGAGGSIGSELSRQIASCKPDKLILFEKHEESLYKIDLELRSLLTPDSSLLAPIVGDVLDEYRVNEVMEIYRPQIIFHAAAYKHVPLMEYNPSESFKTNVLGTKMMAEKADDFGADKFVMISTDKAVNPVNVMGMTKKVAEELVRYFSENGSCRNKAEGRSKETGVRSEEKKDDKRGNLGNNGATKNMIVRFGNVLESSGSVVPLFKDQINKGGPVTVTHSEIERYFMTIPEAVNLVLHAATIGNGGEIFVLDMGKPVKILDLAKRMISLYGYKPYIDIDIEFTGLRPGEKLYEELFNSYEKITSTTNPKINMAISNKKNGHNMRAFVESLNDKIRIKNKFDLISICNKLTGEKCIKFNTSSKNGSGI